MLDLLIEKLHDTALSGDAVRSRRRDRDRAHAGHAAARDRRLGKRMKAVAIEREKMRQRERERLARGEKVTLRRSPKQYMQTIVDQFNLSKWVGQEEARALLVQAGYRGQAPYITFLFFRLVTPAVMLRVLAVLRLRRHRAQPAADGQARALHRRHLSRHACADLYVKNKITAPPALDQARVSGCARPAADLRRIRHVDRGRVPKVASEIGSQSIPLAEEFTLTTAELSYCRIAGRPMRIWPSGRSRRREVGLLALQQTERYGTPMRRPCG